MEEILRGKGGREADNGRENEKAQGPSPVGVRSQSEKKEGGENDFKRGVPSGAGIRAGGGVHQVLSTDA